MQTRIILSCVFGLALVSLAGVAQAATLSKADQQFLKMVATTDMTEAHIGQLAENQAARADVKDFAKTLVQDHTESYGQLNELSGKTGISIPKGINSGKIGEIQQLTHLKGVSFDRQFERDEIADHQRAIAAFRREAAHGENADLKEWAQKRLPVLEKHLQLAEECAKPASHK